MKKFFSIVIAGIMVATLSGCGLSKVSLPFMEENKECHYTVSKDGDIVGAIDAHWKDDEWEVTITDCEETEDWGFTWEGNTYIYEEVSSSVTVRMDEESFDAFIEGCKSDDTISLTEY